MSKREVISVSLNEEEYKMFLIIKSYFLSGTSLTISNSNVFKELLYFKFNSLDFDIEDFFKEPDLKN